ncbi:hypothetical protein [Rhodohalobacter sp. 8-1]|uniref:hypothetical protein n=1 Tax=Rhodohalobacter sp. 8-1 TaxID=3131972 RepID=UPI0030EC45F7
MVTVRIVLLGILLFVAAGCTTSKWTVIDEDAVNSSEQPDVVQSSTQLILDQKPTVENPVLRLAPYNIVQREYAERVQVQRMVQEYKPKWGFALLALTGSALSFMAANSNYLIPSATTTQRITLNATGAMLALLATTNLQEKGPPIMTDEIRYLRQTGFAVRIDTLAVKSSGDETASIKINNDGTILLNEPSISVENGFIEINLGALSSEVSGQITGDSEFVINANYNGAENIYTLPVTDFLEPYFVVQEPTGQVRSGSSITRDNVIAEVGEDSALPVVDSTTDQWVEIRYGNINAFMRRNAGRLEWRSTAADGPALLVELADIPFGEIDVETSVPVIKSRNSADRAYVLSGNNENQAGSNQFSERDEQLFRYYMSRALRLEEGQMTTIEDADLTTWVSDLQSCEEMGGGSLHIYLTGFARSAEAESGPQNLELFHVNKAGDVSSLALMDLFDQLSACTAERMFVYVDLEYVDEVEDGQIISFMNANGGKQQRLANRLLRNFPNAFVLFGNRIGQSSSVYSGSPEDDKRHHIFPYFWAEAIQKRKTKMFELVRHLENNVDYTSRRLHDQPQEVRGYGNIMLDMAE